VPARSAARVWSSIFFRREYGRLVAVAYAQGAPGNRRVEDAVQSALCRAHHLDNFKAFPNDPRRRLYRVRATTASSGIPAESRSPQALEQVLVEVVESGDQPELPCSPARGARHLLRHCFSFAAMRYSRESQLFMALNTCCGFSTGRSHCCFHHRSKFVQDAWRAPDRPCQVSVDGAASRRRPERTEIPAAQCAYGALSTFNERVSFPRMPSWRYPARVVRRGHPALRTLLPRHPLGAIPKRAIRLFQAVIGLRLVARAESPSCMQVH